MKKHFITASIAAFLSMSSAYAGDVSFSDPQGDDKGFGELVYPTDFVYVPGSFDLVGFSITDGDELEFSAEVGASLQDKWGMGAGFSVQMLFVFIDTDGDGSNGNSVGAPGLNIQFAEDSKWDKLVIISPQKEARVKSEVGAKAKDIADSIVVANGVRGKGTTISGKVDKAELGGGDPATWRYQVMIQSNEGFPAKEDLLTRKVNEYEGQHRFGGGLDTDCEPHVIDMLAGAGSGEGSEAQAQYDMLSAFECNADGDAGTPATVSLIAVQ